jgi:hypothetical protein
MKVALSTFTRSGLETHLGADVPGGVQAALRAYARRLKLGPEPLAPPRFFDGLTAPSTAMDLELTLDAETQALLEQEAARHGTTVSDLAVHTVIAYLAELDLRRN